MTKTQLINILAKRAEVIDKDSILFFEDFIKIFFEKINDSEIHYLRGVGHFYACRGVLVDETTPSSSKSSATLTKKIKLVLFHETLEFIDDIYKALVIIPPDEVLIEQNKEEEYFSLSFGKPVISFLKKPEDFQVTDHIRNLGIKASRILKEMEYLDKRKVDEEIKVLKRKSLKLGQDDATKSNETIKNNGDQSESNLNAPEVGSKKSSGKDSSNSSAFDLYYHSKFSHRGREDRGLPWDYSREVFGRKPGDSENPDNKQTNKDFFEDPSKFSVENKKVDDKTLASENKLSSSESFKRVQKISNEATKESTFVNQSGELSHKKIIEFNKVPAPPGEFSEVKTKNTKLETVTDKNGGILENIFQKSADKDSVIDREPFAIRRKRIISIAAILFVVVSIIVIAYGVIESGILFPTDENQNNVITVKRPPSVEVIERDDLIPVTYPYEKQPDQLPVSGISPDAFKNKVNKTVESKNNNQKPEIKKESIPIVSNKKPEIIPEIKKEKSIPPVVKEPIKETENTAHNIFPFQDYFVVEIGIYSVYSVADSEAEKYRNMGYNAVVESAQIGGETKYRLRVGDFTSIQQAERFSRKYRQ